jgi:hypothetical protein
MSLLRVPIKRLRAWLRDARRKLDNKRGVMERHAEGTSYHTRAMREAEYWQSRIAELEEEIAKRE